MKVRIEREATRTATGSLTAAQLQREAIELVAADLGFAPGRSLLLVLYHIKEKSDKWPAQNSNLPTVACCFSVQCPAGSGQWAGSTEEPAKEKPQWDSL